MLHQHAGSGAVAVACSDVNIRRVRKVLASVLGSPWVRLLGSVIAVVLFIRGVDLSEALALYGHLAPGWAVLAVVLAALSVVASTAEWGVLLRGCDQHLDWTFLGSWYLKGLFINQVVPAGVGSDAVRAVQVGKVTGHGPMVASLIASRMAGTLAMSWWALAAAIIARDSLHLPVVTGFVIFAAAMILAWTMALVSDLVRRRIPGHLAVATKIGNFLHPLTGAFDSYRGRPHAIGKCIAAGIFSWGLNLFSMAAFALALGTQVSWSVFALTLPVALLATFIPISANGIGVREGVVVLLLVQSHVPLAVATALALFVDLQMLPFAVLGGLVYLAEHGVRRHRRRSDVADASPAVCQVAAMPLSAPSAASSASSGVSSAASTTSAASATSAASTTSADAAPATSRVASVRDR